MTEYNYFCAASEYNDKDSFQQKRYRVFSQEITKEEYNRIEKINLKLDLKNNTYKKAFAQAWNKAPQSEKDKVLNLPQFDAEMFKKHWGVEIKEKTLEERIERLEKLINKK